MADERQEWVTPKLVLLAHTSDSKASPTSGFRADSTYAGFPNGYS